MSRSLNFKKESGFTLVEVMMVMLLIIVLSKIAVVQFSEISFNTRYQQTAERLNSIKEAIVGNPNQIINGQQAVSGFVADMGRLPINLQELLEQSQCSDHVSSTQLICTTNGFIWSSNPTWGSIGIGACSTGANDTQVNCYLTSGAIWTSLQGNLSAGWHGPYLTVSGNPNNDDAFTDGWGRTSTDGNYGWNFFDGTDLILPASLIIQSLGKDQATDTSMPSVNPESYDDDYPVNINTTPLGTTYLNAYYPNPVVRQLDWQIDVSNGINVSFVKTTKALPVVSFCSNTYETTKAACVAALATWYGACNAAGYYNAGSCASSASWSYCSDGVSQTPSACTTASGTWSYCSDGVSQTLSACTIAGKIWSSCSDGVSQTPSACTTASKTWGYCSDRLSPNLSSCNAAGGVWMGNGNVNGFGFGCSNQTYTTYADCTSPANGTNTWYGCTDGAATTSATCTSPYAWFSSATNIPIPPPQLIPICMKVFYRKTDSTIGVLVSDGNTSNDVEGGTGSGVIFDPVPIIVDGSSQTIKFTGFRDAGVAPYQLIASSGLQIPIGNNAIGIYQYDGTGLGCNSSTQLYPTDRQNPVQVVFPPNTTLPVISW